jgi:hypothetical protein
VENEEKKASDQQHIAGYPMNLEGQGDDNQKYQRHHWALLARLPFSTVFFRLQIKIIIHRKPSHAVLSASQQAMGQSASHRAGHQRKESYLYYTTVLHKNKDPIESFLADCSSFQKAAGLPHESRIAPLEKPIGESTRLSQEPDSPGMKHST